MNYKKKWKAETYMRGLQWGLAPTLLFFAGRSAFSALERPRPILIAGLIVDDEHASKGPVVDIDSITTVVLEGD